MKVYLEPRDWWVGYYRGDTHHYVCPLPCVVIRWTRRVRTHPGANRPPWQEAIAATVLAHSGDVIVNMPPQAPFLVETCPAFGCPWDTRGTLNGAAPALCDEQTIPLPAGCLVAGMDGGPDA